MQAGLFRLGTDFGNGEADRLLFPRDETSRHYLDEKARVLDAYPERSRSCAETEAEQQCLSAAERWLSTALLGEGHVAESRLALPELGRSLVEDFAVLHRNQAGVDRALFVHACFPSGWRPEHVLGKSFGEIHARIPKLEAVLQKTPSLVEAMLTRGPYVRFVWTISADDELDHHPDSGRRMLWSNDTPRGYLRVERQTSVPLAEHAGSVFLIRTYLYGFDELPLEQRRTLAVALGQMPPEIARYKQLELALPRALALLQA